MHASGLEQQARGACFYFFLPLFVFQGLDGGGRGAVGYLLLASALLVCMPAGRVANVDTSFFVFAFAVQFSRTG